ncbi:MAG: hypothetical protein WB685_07005, partial [Pseudolabrys sp.]
HGGAEVTLPLRLSLRKNGTSHLPVRSLKWVIAYEEEHMRTCLITLTALGAVAVALPATTANAQDRTVIVTKDRDHDRGLHRGWTRGHHYGWRNHNAKVVVIKKTRHHHYD